MNIGYWMKMLAWNKHKRYVGIAKNIKQLNAKIIPVVFISIKRPHSLEKFR
jgi:hypothetical protein